MTNLHTIPVVLEYTTDDCKKGDKWLANDIAKTIAEKLITKIEKPIKATLIITYFGLINDKHRNGRPAGEQAQSRGYGIQNNGRCYTGNKKTKSRTNKT